MDCLIISAYTLSAILNMVAPPQNDNWVIISTIDGSPDIQGECEWWDTVEYDGITYNRYCINGELYEVAVEG